jgi:hypothetical protein
VHKVTQKKIYADIANLVQLVTPHQQELAFRLNLQAVLSLNMIHQADLENQTYDFMTNAFTIFEEDIVETEAKVIAL